MTWGKEWPNGCTTPKTEIEIPNDKLYFMTDTGVKTIGIDLGSNDGDIATTVIGKFDDAGKLHIEKVYQNKVPTHDPYTNPDAHIYYQCNCGAVLDPGTKSFAALNNAAMVSGWKVRFGHEYYVPYCAKCGVNIDD